MVGTLLSFSVTAFSIRELAGGRNRVYICIWIFGRHFRFSEWRLPD
jgi:hypothetical protein